MNRSNLMVSMITGTSLIAGFLALPHADAATSSSVECSQEVPVLVGEALMSKMGSTICLDLGDGSTSNPGKIQLPQTTALPEGVAPSSIIDYKALAETKITMAAFFTDGKTAAAGMTFPTLGVDGKPGGPVTFIAGKPDGPVIAGSKVFMPPGSYGKVRTKGTKPFPLCELRQTFNASEKFDLEMMPGPFCAYRGSLPVGSISIAQ